MEKMQMEITEYATIETEYNNTDVFGLQIRCANGEIREYRFISPFSGDVQALICQMRSADISSVHFDDIVADYLKKLFIDKLYFNGLGKYAF